MPISLPKVTLNILPGRTDVPLTAHKVLLVGQQTSAGTATSGVIVNNIQNDSSENTLFGENSMLAAMVRAFKINNIDTQIDALPLDDNGGAVAATGTLTFLGTSTISDTITVSVGSRENHKFLISVVSGDTETTVAAKLASAITADTKAPVTAANVAGVVTFTAVNGGTEANSIGIETTTGTVGQITVSGITPMTGGATDPVTTGVLDTAVGTERYQTMVAPFAFGTSFLTSFLDPRQNVNNEILDGVGYIGYTDTLANISIVALAENSKSLTLWGNELVADTFYEGSQMFDLNTVRATVAASLDALRLTDGANLARFNSTNAGRDSFGGRDIASLPFFNTLLPSLSLIDQDREFSEVEKNTLEADGVSLMGNNRGRTAVILGQVVTTRKTDNAGNPEPIFHFLNAVRTSSVVREFFVLNNKAVFAQSRLTEGGPADGRALVNENQIRAEQFTFYQSLTPTLLQSGEAAIRFFKDNLRVSLDLTSGVVTIDMKPLFVSQLRELQGSIIVQFTAQSA